MKYLRIALNGILLAATTTLITLIADVAFSGNSHDLPVFAALQVFHVSLALAYAWYFLEFLKKGKKGKATATALPLALLILSIALKIGGITFPGFLLIIFDIYILVWSTLLLEYDIGLMRG